MVRLEEALAHVRDSGLEANQDMAVRLMLFLIQQANLALDRNNNAPDFSIPVALAESIRQGVARVLALHPHPGYVADAMQLLYRIKATDDVMALAKMHPVAVQISPTVQAMMGFIHTVAGNIRTHCITSSH
jgi:hypothetical protein